MSKKERIQVQLSVETLDFIRAKTRLVGGSVSSYIRGVLMDHISNYVTKATIEIYDDVVGDGNAGDLPLVEVEKKSEPTVAVTKEEVEKVSKLSHDLLSHPIADVISKDFDKKIVGWKAKLDDDIKKAKDLKGKKK